MTWMPWFLKLAPHCVNPPKPFLTSSHINHVSPYKVNNAPHRIRKSILAIDSPPRN